MFYNYINNARWKQQNSLKICFYVIYIDNNYETLGIDIFEVIKIVRLKFKRGYRRVRRVQGFGGET